MKLRREPGAHTSAREMKIRWHPLPQFLLRKRCKADRASSQARERFVRAVWSRTPHLWSKLSVAQAQRLLASLRMKIRPRITFLACDPPSSVGVIRRSCSRRNAARLRSWRAAPYQRMLREWKSDARPEHAWARWRRSGRQRRQSRGAGESRLARTRIRPQIEDVRPVSYVKLGGDRL